MAWSRFLAVFCVLILPGHYCRQWSSSIPDGAVKYSCTGGFVVFPWAVSLSPGEEISDIQWFFQGPSGAKQMIGVFANGNLFTQPPFSQRVTFVPNAGISISHVTPSDTGNYSVEVKGRNSNGEYFSLSQDNYLRVLDGLQTTDGSLHVQQESSLVHDNVTGEWSVALTCGTFDYGSNQPSVSDVQWTTPEGNTVQSSYYQDGKFHLLLSQPVTGGTYTCQPSSDQAACLHGNSSHALRASVVVDDVKARLAVLETKLQNCCDGTSTPVSQNTGLAHENSNLQNQNALLVKQLANLTEQNHRLVQQHDQQVLANSQLSQQLQTLEQDFTHFKNAFDSAAAHLHDDADSQGQQSCCGAGLDQTVLSLEHQLQNDTFQLIQQLQEHDTRLNNVTQQCSHLSQRVSSVESTTSGTKSNRSVSFQARMGGCSGSGCSSCIVRRGATIPFPQVSHNEGGGYDARDSTFLAPVSGVYFFLASAETSDGSDHAGMLLMHGSNQGEVVDVVHLYHQSSWNQAGAGSVNAVLHLQHGEAVWVANIPDRDSHFRCKATDFSGFLLHRD